MHLGPTRGFIPGIMGSGTLAWGGGIGLNSNDVATSTARTFRGYIFELAVFRGNSTYPGLSEAGRQGATQALLQKYKLMCPPRDCCSSWQGRRAGSGHL